MERFLENVIEAEKIIRTSDHIIYITFPLVKDKRLLLKVLQEIKNAVTLCISAVLQYDYVFKRINLYKDPKSNFKTFIDKCAPRYNITKEEIDSINELFDFIEKHKESPFEFVKDDKVIILSSSLKPKTLTLEKVKEFLILSKEILKKTRDSVKRNF
ncbi:MAG TPA: hypothetical protein ENH99_00685 [Candidatus Pacearchaeota archaeon]|nr:hypothetical protein [Candidatus Pacearchaeota archaeon]